VEVGDGFFCEQAGAGGVGLMALRGVEFVIEEVDEIECPSCHGMAPSGSDDCPLCNQALHPSEPLPQQVDAERRVQEEEAGKIKEEKGRQLREEFSALVAEVGPLITLAKDHSIDTTASRRLIDKAVAQGKRREVDPAVQTMRECRGLLEHTISDRLERDIMYMENLSDVARKMNSDHQAIEKVVADTKERYLAKDYAAALEQTRSGKRLAEQLTGKYVEAHDMYEGLEKLITNSELFYLDVREPRKLLSEAREAGETGDWTTMGILARKGREELNKTLPDMLAAELKKAKQALVDHKSKGRDVTSMIKVLKDAGVSMKRERYEEALAHLTEFRAEEKQA
jgi:hypothetical protein